MSQENSVDYSNFTEAKSLRKQAEDDAQLLANRIALLRLEEQKALKKNRRDSKKGTRNHRKPSKSSRRIETKRRAEDPKGTKRSGKVEGTEKSENSKQNNQRTKID